MKKNFKVRKFQLELIEAYTSDPMIKKIIFEILKKGPIISKTGFKTEQYLLSININDVDVILDDLSNNLMRLGFNYNWELNNLGAKIEGIIDILSNYSDD